MQTMGEPVFRPGLGTGIIWRAYGRFHQVPNEIACAGLNGQLDRNVPGGWYAWLLYSDGRGLAMPRDAGTTVPRAEIWNHCRQIAEQLNHHAPLDGHWVVAWSSRDQEARLLFRDADGDLQVVVEIDARGMGILQRPVHDVVGQAVQAVQTQREIVKGLGADRPTVRLAQGERPH